MVAETWVIMAGTDYRDYVQDLNVDDRCNRIVSYRIYFRSIQYIQYKFTDIN